MVQADRLGPKLAATWRHAAFIVWTRVNSRNAAFSIDDSTIALLIIIIRFELLSLADVPVSNCIWVVTCIYTEVVRVRCLLLQRLCSSAISHQSSTWHWLARRLWYPASSWLVQFHLALMCNSVVVFQASICYSFYCMFVFSLIPTLPFTVMIGYIETYLLTYCFCDQRLVYSALLRCYTSAPSIAALCGSRHPVTFI